MGCHILLDRSINMNLYTSHFPLIPSALVEVFGNPRKSPDGTMIGLIIAILLVVFFVLLIIAIKDPNPATYRKQEETSSKNKCEICHRECDEQYRICPECFEQIQEGKLKKCQLCGKWYPADSVCDCIKKT